MIAGAKNRARDEGDRARIGVACKAAGILAPALLALGWPPAAFAHEPGRAESRVAAEFDDLPEGLVVDKAGNLFTTLMTSGRVIRLRASGEPEPVGRLFPEATNAEGAAVGLDIGPDRKLYIVYVEKSRRYGLLNFNDPNNDECKDATVQRTGIYRMDPDTGVSEPVVRRSDGWPFCFLDDLAVAGNGDIYVTDMTYPGIWKISPDGTDVRMWLRLLPGISPKPKNALFVTGAPNPIALDDKNRFLYVGTILNGMVIRIPILKDGSAGEPETVAEGFGSPDGLEVEDDGRLLVSDNEHSEIWRVSPGKERVLIADSHRYPLKRNTNLAFWKGKLCTANTQIADIGQIGGRGGSIVCLSLKH
jgi:sugar lactone lactonase YvrE